MAKRKLKVTFYVVTATMSSPNEKDIRVVVPKIFIAKFEAKKDAEYRDGMVVIAQGPQGAVLHHPVVHKVTV